MVAANSCRHGQLFILQYPPFPGLMWSCRLLCFQARRLQLNMISSCPGPRESLLSAQAMAALRGEIVKSRLRMCGKVPIRSGHDHCAVQSSHWRHFASMEAYLCRRFEFRFGELFVSRVLLFRLLQAFLKHCFSLCVEHARSLCKADVEA